MQEFSENFFSLPGDGYIPTNIIFFKKSEHVSMLLKMKWISPYALPNLLFKSF